MIGEGGFAKVYVAQNKLRQGEKVALKCTNKSKLIDSEKNEEIRDLKKKYFDSQLAIMNKCKGDNLVELIDHY